MVHQELIELAKSLGLHVTTESYVDASWAARQYVTELVFHMPDVYTPAGRLPREVIARLKFHSQMTQGEYADACGLAYNSLKQLEYWS